MSSFDTMLNQKGDRTSKHPLQTIPIFKIHTREFPGCGYGNKSPQSIDFSSRSAPQQQSKKTQDFFFSIVLNNWYKIALFNQNNPQPGHEQVNKLNKYSVPNSSQPPAIQLNCDFS
ncbi:hypothetical protein [Microcoleus sp. B4-D4]|uniref:hypothetical protein n=1 Tax=Microcoleus sp. B4-D4 TaxID=2818667 RepID=UPI002FD51243